jgi:hypothetical protein
MNEGKDHYGRTILTFAAAVEKLRSQALQEPMNPKDMEKRIRKIAAEEQAHRLDVESQIAFRYGVKEWVAGYDVIPCAGKLLHVISLYTTDYTRPIGSVAMEIARRIVAVKVGGTMTELPLEKIMRPDSRKFYLFE